MAFNTHKDHFALGTASGSALSHKESASDVTNGVTAEAEDELGDVVATDTFAERKKLTSSFVVVDDLAVATSFILGTLTETKAVLTEVNISTEKGKAPTVEASGEDVSVWAPGETSGAAATQGATITPDAFTVLALHKAQILFSAFTLGGTGCKLNSCNAKISCNLSLAENAGGVVAHDVQRGMIEVTATIIQPAAAEPTVTAASNWKITKPLSKTEPEGGHDMWTVTLTKPLTTTPAV